MPSRFQSAKVFFRELLTHPSCMGTLCPSSKRLAEGVAREVISPPDGYYVVELGAGTGAITTYLLQRIPLEKLLIIERSADLAEHLQSRFPHLTIIQGDASDLAVLLKEKISRVATVVSSLPCLSLSKDKQQALIAMINKLPIEKGRWVHFTYGFLKPHPLSVSSRLKKKYQRFIWRNVPPAWVEVYDIV